MPFDSMEIPALHRDMTVRAETANEAERTVDLVWTTGATVRRRRFFEDDFDEQLIVTPQAVRLERLNAGAPLLNAHNGFSLDGVIGVVVENSVRIENGRGTATIRFSERDDVEPIFRDIVAGIIRNVSVGYRVHKYEIEKRDGAPELWRAVDWEPYEISAVPIGADSGAQFRSAERAETNPCVIARNDETAVQPALRKDASPMTKKTPAAGTEGGEDNETRALQQEPDTTAIDAARAGGQKAERERLDAIDDLAKRHLLGAEWIKRMKDSTKSVLEIRSDAIDEIAKRDDRDEGQRQISDPSARITRSAEEKFMEGASNAIICRAGQEATVRRAAGPNAPRLDPGEMRGLRLVDFARASLDFRGERVNVLATPEQIVRRALELSHPNLQSRGAGAGYQNAGDFGTLLENVMHKILLGAYAVTPDTWSRFCKIGSVSDFRAHNRYRLGSFGTLDSLSENGEFKNKKIPDGEKYTITAGTKGNMIALTRQAIINDDLGAFSDLATMFGRAAKLSIESDVYALLALNAGLGPLLSDGVALFNAAAHKNEAIAGAISVAVFDDARVKMKSQKDVSGNEVLDLIPSILVVPAGSGGNARVIVDAVYDPDTANKLQKPNMVKGIVSDIVDTARLSGTRFYMFADPNVSPVLEVAFLNGQQEPFLDSEEGWRTDGIEWKVRIDYGTAGQDYRGAITGAGV